MAEQHPHDAPSRHAPVVNDGSRGAGVPACRLLIFEGIMGSGKSTATRHFGQVLAASGAAVVAFTEAADPHPVRASDDLADFFQPWNEIAAPVLAQRARQKWARYVRHRLDDGVVTVMDGQLFHGDLTNLFMMDMGAGDLLAHSLALMDVLAPLHPVVVYLRPADLEDAMRRVLAARGADWKSYQLRWKLQSPYAMRRQLSGVEGLVSMYAAYRALTDSLFDALDCPKLTIDTSCLAWEQVYADVFLLVGARDR